MTDDQLMPAPPPDVRLEPAPLQQVEVPPAVGAELPPPSASQVRAVDGIFAHARESDQVMGVLGMWTGVLVLHDLAIEHFQRPPEEDHPRLSSRPRDDKPTP